MCRPRTHLLQASGFNQCFGMLILGLTHLPTRKKSFRRSYIETAISHTVDGRNPAPADKQFIQFVPFFWDFLTSQVVVWDFWSINSMALQRCWTSLRIERILPFGDSLWFSLTFGPDTYEQFYITKTLVVNGWWLFGWWFQIFFIFQRYLQKWSKLTNIFQMGWNHQPVINYTLFCREPYKSLESNDGNWNHYKTNQVSMERIRSLLFFFFFFF